MNKLEDSISFTSRLHVASDGCFILFPPLVANLRGFVFLCLYTAIAYSIEP